MSQRAQQPHVSLQLGAGLLLAGLVAACSGQAPEPQPASPPTSTSATPTRSTTTHVGSRICATCHAEAAARHADSGHRLAMRAVDDDTRPMSAQLGPTAKVPSAASPPSFTVADASGGAAPRLVSHVIGGRRREDFLTRTEGGLQVLPSSWSISEQTFLEPTTLEFGSAPLPHSPYFWSGKNRSYENSCSRCHGGDTANKTQGAQEHGISCEDCHGPGGDHVARANLAKAKGERLQVTEILLSAPDAWSGCAHCHAVGDTLPETKGIALNQAVAFDATLLVATAHGSQGPNRAFYLDGRPASAHAYEVQALAQSACARVGQLTCLSCHDPHGGLKGDTTERSDPDTSCKACHAKESGDPSRHAGHPVQDQAVPLARSEATGPNPSRLPGCVDCHMPAITQFGSQDKARTHVISIPEPELARDLGTADACLACHRDELSIEALVDSLNSQHPERKLPRHERALTFVSAALLLRSQDATPDDILPTVSQLTEVLADTKLDDWTRASAAHLLAAFGNNAEGASSALLEAADTGDVVLARAALRTLGLIGTTERDRLAAIGLNSSDWRVRVVAANALAHLGDERGSTEFLTLMEKDSLPLQAHLESRFGMGMALLKQGAFQRAEFFFTEITRLDPENSSAWLTIGALRAGRQDVDGARFAWQTVLDINPHHAQAEANLQKLAESEAGD